MNRTILGKIEGAEIGIVDNYPFLFGLKLKFSLEGGSIVTDNGSKHTVNMSKECKWDECERRKAITKAFEHIYNILKAAKVRNVSDLVGIPVEVTIENNGFKDFRILTEVL